MINRNNPECSIGQHLVIRPSGPEIYRHLASYHYRNAALGPCSHLFGLFDEHPQRRRTVPAAGVIVYRGPAANLATRNVATGGYFSALPRTVSLALLNEHVRCISRVIIEPRYRGLGLASRLVRQTLPQTGAAMVEATSVRGLVQPFFERAGMLRFRRAADVKTERLKAALETVGIGERLWIDAAAVHAHLSSLDRPQRAFIEQQINAFLQKFARQRNMPHCQQRTDFILSKLGDPGCYYLWLNPDKPVPGLHIAS